MPENSDALSLARAHRAARWEQANARHAQHEPDLTAFCDLLESYLEQSPCDISGNVFWADRAGQMRVMAMGQKCNPAASETDWVSLAAMKAVLRPQFSFLPDSDHEVSDDDGALETGAGASQSCNLFGTWIACSRDNTSAGDQLALAHDIAVSIPPASAFVMSDVKHLDPLLERGARGAGLVGERTVCRGFDQEDIAEDGWICQVRALFF